MARIGYARVSSADQDLDIQIAKLQAEGCAIIRGEKVSGASREGRAELETVIQFLRPGDELVVTRLDRLGRDTRDVLNLIYDCEQRGAFVTVLDPHISTRGEMGHVVLTVLGMVAQMERRFIKERQREGIERAKADGRYLGGTRRIDRSEVKRLRAEGTGPSEIAQRWDARACKCIVCLLKPSNSFEPLVEGSFNFSSCGSPATSDSVAPHSRHSGAVGGSPFPAIPAAAAHCRFGGGALPSHRTIADPKNDRLLQVG